MNRPSLPPVCLVGEDGNAFAVIGAVARALREDGQPESAQEWTERAMICRSYDELLRLVFEYAEPY